MNKRNLLVIGELRPGAALIALPASSAGPQKPDASAIARLQQRIDALEAKITGAVGTRTGSTGRAADADALEESARALTLENQEPAQIEVQPKIATDDLNISIGDDGSSWLGVEHTK